MICIMAFITQKSTVQRVLQITSAHNNRSFLSADASGSYDLIVVGGGIIGCATAREMKIRHPRMRIAIVEKEKILAKHQTGHNSGVIHAGIYYKPGSIKAKLCVQGLRLAYDYLNEKKIPHKKIGKLIVARNEAEVRQLEELYDRGLKNGCPDIELVGKERISNIEPECLAERAIWSPWTGIVDWGLVCRHFAEDFKSMGGDVFLDFEVLSIAESAAIADNNAAEHRAICLHSKNKYLKAKYVLTCGGLHSDRLAVMTGCDSSPRIVPVRGEYLLLDADKGSLVSTNIYPVPDSRFPFLGVHFTPRMNGDIWLGPNAVLALAREGYSWFDVNLADCLEMLRFPGLYKFCFRYILPGLNEMVKSIFYPLSVSQCRTFVPKLALRDVRRGPAGIRAQALDNDGNLVDDFVFDGGQGPLGQRVLHCRNAPSPGATSSMAIAKFISDKLENDFQL